jgi:hypothetical protein
LIPQTQLVPLQLACASAERDAATGDLALRERDVDLHDVVLGTVGQRSDPRDPVAHDQRDLRIDVEGEGVADSAKVLPLPQQNGCPDASRAQPSRLPALIAVTPLTATGRVMVMPLSSLVTACLTTVVTGNG